MTPGEQVVSAEEARRLFERHGAIRSGHFELTSGRHSDLYVEKARVLQWPEATMAIAREIASWYPGGIDVVVAPAVGAIPLGFAVAVGAGARSVYAERQQGKMQLRRGFAIEADERALVVEDVVTTGASAAEVFHLVEEAGAESLGVAALVDRSTGPLPFPLRAVVRVVASTWESARCPMCARGVPVEAPGSRHLAGAG
jgi:orotate phosphoribosyltransferase